jgi:hypothetical protein
MIDSFNVCYANKLWGNDNSMSGANGALKIKTHRLSTLGGRFGFA